MAEKNYKWEINLDMPAMIIVFVLVFLMMYKAYNQKNIYDLVLYSMMTLLVFEICIHRKFESIFIKHEVKEDK